MNMCIYGTIAKGVETLRARVEHNMERGANKFCSEWKLAAVSYTHLTLPTKA